jgi:hypothetical protein
MSPSQRKAGRQEKEAVMNMTKVLTIASAVAGLTVVSMAAALYAPAVFAGDSSRVVGEKLDSGLGELPSNYTGAEFSKSTGYRVLGEKQDSGLGQLSSDYTGAEFSKAAVAVIGEKQDSGLGQLSSDYTGAEFSKAALAVVGEKQDSGLGQLSSDYTGAEFSKADGYHVAGEKLDSGLGEIVRANRAGPALIQASAESN